MRSGTECRVFPRKCAAGAVNMAIDEAMLERAAGENGCASLRVYCWSEPTLSIGYFQVSATAAAEPRWRDLPLVRRPTGGGAILHDHELTYALVVPREHPLSRQTRALYRAVHTAIGGLLQERGVPIQRRGTVESTPTDRPFLCFCDREADDLVVSTAKVVGSAQRRKAGAVLQHGSLLLAHSRFAPEVPGLTDLGHDVPDDDWDGELERRIASALDLAPTFEPWSDGLLDWANELETAVYSMPAWTMRR